VCGSGIPATKTIDKKKFVEEREALEREIAQLKG
jgi:hypothetical protein